MNTQAVSAQNHGTSSLWLNGAAKARLSTQMMSGGDRTTREAGPCVGVISDFGEMPRTSKAGNGGSSGATREKPGAGLAYFFLLLAGCHQQADAGDYLIIGGLALFVWVIWRIDVWRLEAGYRVEPAPYVNMSEPTKIVKKAEGQQAGEPK